MNNKLRLQTCFCNKAFKMALRSSIINSGKGGDSSVLGTNDFAQFLYKIFIISNFCKEVIRFCFTFQVQKYVLLTNNIFLLFITIINFLKWLKKGYLPKHQRMFRCHDWGRNIYHCSDPNPQDTSPKLKKKTEEEK